MKRIEPFNKRIYVTQPLLPDLEGVSKLLKEIWDSCHLTNNGNMVKMLEKQLSEFLKVNYLSLFSNGTSALQLACKVLDLSGEVITTPFTFAATPHALALNNLKPVFCDIEEETLNIDPEKIEPLINSKTSAILPVHVFGNPCNVRRIEDIARKYDLKVVYDAAHAFAVEVDGKPIGGFGDISMFSLHATKVYHTVEGGALVFNNMNLKQKADCLRNFGILDDGDVIKPGINAKLNELQAAIGIEVLKVVKDEIENRKNITYLYRQLLEDLPGIKFSRDIPGVTHNYPYFVIRIEEKEFGLTRDRLFEELKKFNVFCRKYFYPLCSQFSCYKHLASSQKDTLPVAEKAARQVIALPLYGALSQEEVEKICDIIKYLRKKKGSTLQTHAGV